MSGQFRTLAMFLLSDAFVGLFQNDLGSPKHALELRDYVKYMFSFFFSLFIMVWNSRYKK